MSLTVAQAIEMIAPSRLVIMGRQVLFNTWDEQEAAYWSGQGATVREFYPPNELYRSKSLKQGWEIILNLAIVPVTVTKLNGEEEDITASELVKQARAAREGAGV